jgi:hypothetical protein
MWGNARICFVRVSATVALLAVLSAQAAPAERPRGIGTSGRRLDLKALVFAVLEVNRVYCGVNNIGEICRDPTRSWAISGGFWPKGSPNYYIFNSGLQLAGHISDTLDFAWAGDTVGAYIMDGRGDAQVGEGISLVYNSLDPDDLAAWPAGAMVRDTAIYHDLLIGRKRVSHQDLWARLWDGNPAIHGNRDHPLGILMDQRVMGWTFPSGNEDVVFVAYTFYNITAEDRSVYAGLHPDIRDSIADVAQSFVAGVEDYFDVDLPAGGYAFEDFYAAFYMDPDVGRAGWNYSTAVLPFQMATTYNSTFLEPEWSYPPYINGPPFAAAPGFIGVKYLRSPTDPATGEERGLTLFSLTVNPGFGGSFPRDPVGIPQLWRYLSGNAEPAAGDRPCDFPNPEERRLCYLVNVAVDIRFFQSSGPFTLPPGEAATIVVAYVHAAPVAAPLEASGQVGGDLPPYTPYTGDSIFFGTCDRNPAAGSLDGDGCVREIDQIAGWVAHNDADGSLSIEEDEVLSVPGSLLDKAMVAQAVFDNKFLLPFAPEPPTFYLVAGDNEVTVVWERSVSEIVGDPFFAVAGDPAAPLYDPNFRQFDVEGYRIYRGRTSSQLELIAQFDYAGTSFVDATGAFDYGNLCAPELNVTSGCPADFYNSAGTGAGETYAQDLSSVVFR